MDRPNPSPSPKQDFIGSKVFKNRLRMAANINPLIYETVIVPLYEALLEVKRDKIEALANVRLMLMPNDPKGRSH